MLFQHRLFFVGFHDASEDLFEVFGNDSRYRRIGSNPNLAENEAISNCSSRRFGLFTCPQQQLSLRLPSHLVYFASALARPQIESTQTAIRILQQWCLT